MPIPAGVVALVFGGGVIVGGTTTCPDPGAVQARVPGGSDPHSRDSADRAELTRDGNRLRVQLRDGHGSLLAERQLDAASSCAGLAQAAAVVIGAMELEVWSVPAVDEVPLPSPAAKTAPVESAAVTRASSLPIAPPRFAWDVGPAVLALADSGGRSTWALGLTVALAPRRTRLRPELGLFAAGRRDLSVDGGKVGYERYWLSLGVGYELKWGRWEIEPQAELLGAVLVLQGDGITSSATETTGDLGGQVGLTARWSFGAGSVWAGVFGLWWPDGTQVQLGRIAQSRGLPPWEGLLGGGIRFGTG